jgi:hypothetical protein
MDRGGIVTTYKKKLIEVAIPLEAINAASAREKSIRHGHPSTLHLWWARRPLAACRAVLFAQLVDDPSSHPEEFPNNEAVDAGVSVTVHVKPATQTRTFIGFAVNSQRRILKGRERRLGAKSLSGGPLGQQPSRTNCAQRQGFIRPPEDGERIWQENWRRAVG